MFPCIPRVPFSLSLSLNYRLRFTIGELALRLFLVHAFPLASKPAAFFSKTFDVVVTLAFVGSFFAARLIIIAFAIIFASCAAGKLASRDALKTKCTSLCDIWRRELVSDVAENKPAANDRTKESLRRRTDSRRDSTRIARISASEIRYRTGTVHCTDKGGNWKAERQPPEIRPELSSEFRSGTESREPAPGRLAWEKLRIIGSPHDIKPVYNIKIKSRACATIASCFLLLRTSLSRPSNLLSSSECLIRLIRRCLAESSFFAFLLAQFSHAHPPFGEGEGNRSINRLDRTLRKRKR